jgi:hypothetical protein
MFRLPLFLEMFQGVNAFLVQALGNLEALQAFPLFVAQHHAGGNFTRTR